MSSSEEQIVEATGCKSPRLNRIRGLNARFTGWILPTPVTCKAIAGKVDAEVLEVARYLDHLERCCLMALRDLNDARDNDPERLADPVVTSVRAWMCMVADAIEAEARYAPPASVPSPPEPERPLGESREGMVTVYDERDAYLGCMGVETWKRLLAEQSSPGQAG